MKVDAFDFDLPDDRIALRPAVPRDAARMLVVTPPQTLSDHVVRDLPAMLRPGDLLVVNDTRVIPARLDGRRTRDATTARVEALLHLREAPDRWRAFLRPAKRVRVGEILQFGGEGETDADRPDMLSAEVVEKGEGGEAVLRFALAGPALDAAIVQVGALPLPPYIAGRRPTDARDAVDYQTLFAQTDGAVAAPTAGLHFTPDLLDRLAARGVGLIAVTLHVGAGTFLPVKADDTADHRMHAEWGRISTEAAAALNATREASGRIVAVGTTALRLLESAADEAGRFSAWEGTTSIFITPGHRFRSADLLLTNFHLPRSTLFMLVAAFSGLAAMQRAYAHAIAAGYRFYSYGDASLLARADPEDAA